MTIRRPGGTDGGGVSFGHEAFGGSPPDQDEAGRAECGAAAACGLPRRRGPAQGRAADHAAAGVRLRRRRGGRRAVDGGEYPGVPAVALAPTGYTRMMHPDGEIGAARAAQRHGLPYTLSTMATTTIEDVAAGAQPDLWFQLYILRDSGLSKELVDRAAAAGYRVLVVTVDCFVTGHRTRDRRNGLVIPPELTVTTLASIASRPGYWVRMLRSPLIDFANFTGHPAVTIEGTGSLFNPAITWDDIASLRDRWPGKLVIKGPLGPADARQAVSLGADGLQLSNHGGRQLDRTVAPADL